MMEKKASLPFLFCKVITTVLIIVIRIIIYY